MKGTSGKLPGFGESEAIADALVIADFRFESDELKVSGARFQLSGKKNKKGVMPCTLNPKP